MDLIRHEKIHKNIRNEICKYCAKGFIYPSNLQKHIKYIHKNNIEIKPYICKKCLKKFVRKDSLIKHLQSHLNKKERKLYKCNHHQCNSLFTSKSNRNRHIKIIHK
eukprot:2580_1